MPIDTQNLVCHAAIRKICMMQFHAHQAPKAAGETYTPNEMKGYFNIKMG